MRHQDQAAVAVLLAAVVLDFSTAPADAQTSVFCPSDHPVFLSGNCTNATGTEGSLGVPALAAQSLSETSQSITQQSNGATVDALRKRRAQEAEPSGASSGAMMFAPQSLSYQANPLVAAPTSGSSFKAEPLYADTGVHPAVWTYGFGGFERRTADFQTAFQAVGMPVEPEGVSVVSKTEIWGVVSGADLTFPNMVPGGGTLIAGVLTGYTTSDVDVSAISTSPTPSNPGTSSSVTHIRLSGPSAGAYATVFEGPVSADLTFKADFLDINDNFFLALGCCSPPSLNSGTVSAHVDNLSAIGNLNYRFPLSFNTWVEPTAGFNYTYSLYDDAAQAMGLANGYVLRLQDGARLGWDFLWHDVHITPTITGLLYDDVTVTGGPILNAAFVGGQLLPSDEGKLRGEGVLAVNFEFSHGFSSFVSAAIYGGEDLIGGGGAAGVRYQW
jgi:Autotransporter beta-domain